MDITAEANKLIELLRELGYHFEEVHEDQTHKILYLEWSQGMVRVRLEFPLTEVR